MIAKKIIRIIRPAFIGNGHWELKAFFYMVQEDYRGYLLIKEVPRTRPLEIRTRYGHIDTFYVSELSENIFEDLTMCVTLKTRHRPTLPLGHMCKVSNFSEAVEKDRRPPR